MAQPRLLFSRFEVVLGKLKVALLFVGVLFVCFTVDHKLLFTNYGDQDVEDSFFFYTTFYNAPQVIRVCRRIDYYCCLSILKSGLQVFLHTMMGAGLLSLIAKLHRWDDTAMYFDGSALGTQIACHYRLSTSLTFVHIDIALHFDFCSQDVTFSPLQSISLSQYHP